MTIRWTIVLAAVMAHSLPALAKTVKYELTIDLVTVNKSGKQTVDFAMAVNGKIPAPVLQFVEGDEAEITVKNLLDEETSVHWHGILLPNVMDGVSYLTTPPILPKSTYTFRFPIRQSGTYWYHSHTGTQEQKGVLGAIVIQPNAPAKFDQDVAAIVSDWIDANPDQVIKNLKKDGDYYLHKKGTVQSWLGAIQAGALGTYLGNEVMRMGGMDLSDVGYDAFLINGAKSSDLITAKAGERIRIRLINGSASTYFYVSLAGLPFEVISADGKDVVPVTTKELLMGMGETYDLVFTVPANKKYELRATSQDILGYASAYVRAGDEVVPAPTKTPSNPYMSHMSHAGHAETNSDQSPKKHDHAKMLAEQAAAAAHAGHAGHADHDAHASGGAAETLTYEQLRATDTSSFPSSAPIKEFTWVLDGDMERYVWHLNGKLLTEADEVEINEGDVIKFILDNRSMMHHPMHLHGHFFRLDNGNGAQSPWKHTVDMPPFSKRTITFQATEPGRWLFHCHNLYHMKSGMGRVLAYKDFKEDPSMTPFVGKPSHHDHWYGYGLIDAYSNFGSIYGRISSARYQLDSEFTVEDYEHPDLSGKIFFRSWASTFFNVGVGAIGPVSDPRGALVLGYTLPLLLETNFTLDQEFAWGLEVEKKFQWTSHIYSVAAGEFSEEARAGSIDLMYAFNWHLAAGVRYGSESKLGLGVTAQF